MGRFQKLINGLYHEGRFQQGVYDELLRGNGRVVPVLMREVIENPNSDVRETCAELLRDWKQARAVPALIEALRDDCEYVRQDALWAIGKLCGFDYGGFENLLDVGNTDRPGKLYRRVNEWWEANRRFVENNPTLW
ncbi:MAG: HEAT repeat domain-containing protein [Candidatus Hydrogenedentes bacterium]|nr:HEAT repeat domain-containing protein [Candidatus Hydrogenedentota bacterium]